MPDNLYRVQRKEDFARHAKRGFMVTRINKIEVELGVLRAENFLQWRRHIGCNFVRQS